MNAMTFRALIETSGMSPAQAQRLDDVSHRLDELNAAVRAAVHEGLSVELQRSSRHHCGAGCWGDQMRPIIAKCA